MKLREIQKEVASKEKTGYRKIKVTVYSDILLEPYYSILLKKLFISSELSVEVDNIRYEDFILHQYKQNASDMLVVFLNLEMTFMNYLNAVYSEKRDYNELIHQLEEQCRRLYTDIKREINCPVLWFGFEDYGYHMPYVLGNVVWDYNLPDKMNQFLLTMLDKTEDVFIDTKKIIATVGICDAFCMKSKYRWNAPYSEKMVEAIASETYKQYKIIHGETKKCIILDCDNVLWGGIVSEDGMENIKLGEDGTGRYYQDFQRYLLWLYYQGVILAVCSKNDMQDIRRIFREHSGMILREEHIACFRVNWNDKVSNIKRISEILNISFDSMVYVDDMAFEINTVKIFLPEITAVLYNRYTIYEQLSCFNLKQTGNVFDIERRNQTYQSNEKREKLKRESTDEESYFKNLEISIDIHLAERTEYARISELTQRANRCTNGKRYTVSELKNLEKEDEYTLYSVFVSDKFSDLGLVGTIGIRNTVLDLFALSCRALGRNIEVRIFDNMLFHKITKFEFISTGKNDRLREFMKDRLEKSMIKAEE